MAGNPSGQVSKRDPSRHLDPSGATVLVAISQNTYVMAMILSALRNKPPLVWLPFFRTSGARKTVAVLRLDGPIMAGSRLRRGLNLAAVEPLLERAFSQRRLAAVALVINSPGGSPAQSALIADRIRALADKKGTPVIAFVEDVAASGGYWLACSADEIYANSSSIVGSIGVIYAGFGFHGLLERHGIERRLHTAGDRKSMLDPFTPVKDSDLKRLASLQKGLHETFRQHVRERRGERLKGSARTLFSGEFWTGGRALELGLIDGLGDVRSVMEKKLGRLVRFRAITRRASLGTVLSRSTVEGDGLAHGIVSAVEERLHWQRYGL